MNELSNKFRELKSLIYDYRDKKEGEIKELNEEGIETESIPWVYDKEN